MSVPYKDNPLYRSIELFCKLRGKSISEMCKTAEISPGIITDLKMGRKKTIQIETATKIAKALDIPVGLLENCPYSIYDEWSVDTCMMWFDADSEYDKLFLLKNYGIPKEHYAEALDLIVAEYSSSQQNADSLRLSQRDQAWKDYAKNRLDTAQLITAFNKLNDKGQQVAVERVEELTKIPDYQRAEEE